MIKLENVNKYFNKHKKNQIHVINNTSITFPNFGLVAILGPSGCGKTTLLNVIGGLDKVSNGNIYVNGQKITKKSSKHIDEIRNLNIGYIFQDYKLVDNMSVYDNVALSLKIIGIKDKAEIDKRVMYTLEKVNMDRYKNRPAGMLSGGERQRVGIARALVKNPKIIIADEPTGNLDSKNSLEIMNIIKSISNKYLVILVTHEEELARFYATRIIELKDGIVIKDYENQNVDALNYQIENRIYLKDYKDIQKIQKDNMNINIYRNNNEELNINVVFKNGNIYIETKTGDKIEVVENNSNIELLDKHYEEIKNHNITTDFDIEKVANSNYKTKYSSIFKLGSFISYGFKKLLDYPILKKILLGGFFLSGMFIFYAVSSILATLNIEDKDFITFNKKYLTATVNNLSVNDYESFANNASINYILPNNSLVTFKIKYDKYLQTKFGYGLFSASLSSLDMLKDDDIYLGRMPQNDYEIVVDKMVINNFINQNDSKSAGFAELQDFLNHDIYLNNMPPFRLVGISDLEEPNIYANKDMFINMIANSVKEDNYNDYNENNILDYKLFIDKEIKLVKGNLPLNDYEIIVNKDQEEFLPINQKIDTKINGQGLKVVGYYENIDNTSYNNIFTNVNTIKQELIMSASSLTIYPNDKEEAINLFHQKKVYVRDSYEYAKKEYLSSQHDTIVNTLIISGVILGISLIEILLMIRSSFLSRIKEVGIYRAIGIKKGDIYKMFSGEILAITCTSCFTGIILMSYILSCLKKVPYIGSMYMVNPFTLLVSIIIVLIFNLLVGLLPVYNTIKKTPAAILARYDVD